VEEAQNEYEEDNEVKTLGSKRAVELLQPAYAALERLSARRESGIVFVNPATNGEWTNRTISKEWNKALAGLELTAREAYQTRHTNATILLNAGLPLAYIQAQFGHSNYQLLERAYTKWLRDDSDVVEWVRKKTQGGHNGPRFESFFFRIQ
jgi:integrase